MNLDEVDSSHHQQKAFECVVRALNFNKVLPENVFVGSWSCFLFFQSDYIFSPDFMSAATQLLHIEQAKVACLINLDRTKKIESSDIEAIFVNETTSGEMYDSRLRNGGPASGWLYGVDRFACASNIGEWCIYSEKGNDVAVIGLRDAGGGKKFERPLSLMNAKPIEDLVEGGKLPTFPFDKLTQTWRNGLLENFG
jgi:hypothetical protein